MSVGYVGKTTNLSREVIAQQAQAEREDQWGNMPGEIVDYDHTKGTATIRPLFKKRKADGSDLPMPDLMEVPIDFPRSGNSAITHPLPAGTKVNLRPQMRSMENYDVDNEGTFSDARSSNLSDMRASISGGDSLTDPLPNVDPGNVHIRFNADGTHGLRGSPDGKFKLEGSEGNIFDFLVQNVEKTAEGFTLLGTEPDLVHRAQYAEIGEDLTDLAEKLRAMVL
ncbi:hypothetical protein HQ945_08320 [Phyllobacterium sp. BT25]|uniref:Phage protein Gp138 N-terminal domain-containing protein n=1 Tax=Phyllobacterium pellucidum TaxID=2740464 RepID=A0A849VMY7_9HYPH|nr:Gp138 family membrane-puncturing spike protein [Phyllobacterium pellucidum]NTS31258.1 hypothetical protein [Phyllobacterium pellucidum]